MSLHTFIRLCFWMAGFLWWCCVTTWLGFVTVVGVLRFLPRLPRLFAQTIYCPRGHTVPVHGVYTCACGAVHEGWVFGKCRVCHERCTWTPCPECSLPVQNPLGR